MNPLIELAKDPVTTLTLAGYALGLATLVFITLAGTWSNIIWLRARFEYDRPQKWEYIPPATWTLRAAAVPGVLMIDVWALAAFIWLVTP